MIEKKAEHQLHTYSHSLNAQQKPLIDTKSGFGAKC